MFNSVTKCQIAFTLVFCIAVTTAIINFIFLKNELTAAIEYLQSCKPKQQSSATSVFPRYSLIGISQKNNMVHHISGKIRKKWNDRKNFYEQNVVGRYVANQDYEEKLYKISILPQVNCAEQIRIGNPRDGGKWVCNPFMLNNIPNCTVYSLGMGDDVTFEIELAKIHGGKCRTLGFDSMLRPNLYDNLPNSVSQEMNISSIDDKNTSKITIPTIMAMNGHSKIDIFKVDIEGSEKEIFPFLLTEISPEEINPIFCQILIELHWEDRYTLLQKFEKSGFWLFHIEPNPLDTACFEAAMIHEGCRETYGVEPPVLKNFEYTKQNNVD